MITTLIETELRYYHPAFALERELPRRWRRSLLVGLSLLIVVGILLLLLDFGRQFIAGESISLTELLTKNQYVTGLLCISSALVLSLWQLSCFFNARYYRGIATLFDDREKHQEVVGITYEVAQAISYNPHDLTGAFIQHHLGRLVLLRAGIDGTAIDAFRHTQRATIAASRIILPRADFYTFKELGTYIYEQDESLQAFLTGAGVTELIFKRSLAWVGGSLLTQKHAEHWWGRDILEQTAGIGRDWVYGHAYLLKRYSKPMTRSTVIGTPGSVSGYAAEKIEQIETALARSRAANVLVVGEPGVGKMDMLAEIKLRSERGEGHPALDDSDVIVLDMDRLFAAKQTKQAFESLITTLLTQAAQAGNLIVVFDAIHTSITEARALEVDLLALLDPFLNTPEMHIVALTDSQSYHELLEQNGAFMRRFAAVLIEPPEQHGVISILEGIAEQLEGRRTVFFTYPAIAAIARSADRRIVQGVMPDKAIQLLTEIVPVAEAQGGTVTAELVYGYVGEKTHIPIGPVTTEEREQLLNLEAILHERIIGQEPAITAISSTMRRARTDIQDADRPLGSFLFLGPTGVGKTETAKALAYIFFGSEEALKRLDMSEFSGTEGLSRIIGAEGKPGVLSSTLTDHPYSLLLLDEFEKAAEDVHDLFLQILDEGIFTDARGKRINARNTIIIATSNAGSGYIMDAIAKGRSIGTLKDEIINRIIDAHIYKPELINRFDNVILFEPLKQNEQRSVAHLMLRDLTARIAEKGYTLKLDDALIDALVTIGYSAQFGARPMRRAIQNTLEDAIARKIIAGSIRKGDTITLTEKDIQKAPR